MPKITKRLVEAVEPQKKDILVWDSELKGFHFKVTPKGKRIYMLYYRTKDGRQRKPAIGTHGNITCDQAREIAIHWLSDLAKGKDPSLSKQLERVHITVGALAEKYLQEYASIYKKPLSIKRDKVLLKHHIVPAIGNIKINSLTTKDIAELHYKMRNMPISANRAIALLSKMFNLSEEWGIRKDAGSLCKYIKKYPENKRDRFLSMLEIEKLLDILNEMEFEGIELSSSIAAIRLLLLTGCRLSEILTLKWEYIDITNYRIHFPDSKTGKKTIYISPYVLEILNSIEKKHNNPYVVYGAIEGAHLVNLQKPWCRIRKKAKLEDVRLHDLRHSFASIGAASGLSLPVIGALLGHTNTQTTARYAHLIGDSLRDAANVIGERIKSVTK